MLAHRSPQQSLVLLLCSKSLGIRSLSLPLPLPYVLTITSLHGALWQSLHCSSVPSQPICVLQPNNLVEVTTQGSISDDDTHLVTSKGSFYLKYVSQNKNQFELYLPKPSATQLSYSRAIFLNFFSTGPFAYDLLNTLLNTILQANHFCFLA